MIGCKMGLAKKCKNTRSRMCAANLRDLRCSMPVTRSDLAHVAARLQVNSINRTAKLAGLTQQMGERLPVITPFIVIADGGAEFVFTDFTTQPFVQYILITAVRHFQGQHNRPVALCKLAEQCSGKLLGCCKSVIIAQQENISRGILLFKFGIGQSATIVAESFSKIAD